MTRPESQHPLAQVTAWFKRRAEARGMRRELFEVYSAMIDAMDAADFLTMRDNYEIWRAFIGFGEGFLEYVHPDRYGWQPNELHVYVRLKETTEAFRALRAEWRARGMTVPELNYRAVWTGRRWRMEACYAY